MVKLRVVYRCSECGASAPKWAGRCVPCGAWNSMVEDVEAADTAGAAQLDAQLAGASPPQRLGEVDLSRGQPVPCGLAEVDRVLGGGLVPGSVTLLGGEPGVGKSTLLLQLAAGWAGSVLYVTAEESATQVRGRAQRLGVDQLDVWLLAESVLARIVDAVDSVQPTLLIVDSIQTIAEHTLGAAPGGVVQVRGCAQALIALAKARGLPTVLVGHVTKDGSLAGPRLLEHMVDTVLSFEGDRDHGLRLLRATKHRFGPTTELGVFEMAEAGLRAVPDASELFLTDRRTGIPGSTVTSTLDGQRPLLVEVQALTARAASGAPPRRSAQGIDAGRLALLLAVLDQRARLPVGAHEVFVSAVGGIRLADPGADLAVCAAIFSALNNQPLPPDVVVIGEVGLGGEVRQASNTQRRLAEAARLGFHGAVVPANSSVNGVGLRLLRAATVTEAIRLLGA